MIAGLPIEVLWWAAITAGVWSFVALVVTIDARRRARKWEKRRRQRPGYIPFAGEDGRFKRGAP